jgi:hypothetical protein
VPRTTVGDGTNEERLAAEEVTPPSSTDTASEARPDGVAPAVSAADQDPEAAGSAPIAHESAADATTPGADSHRRWWWAVGIGGLISLPLAWLLSYAGMLMCYIGLYFFALFGLIIGAILFRIAAPARPYRPLAIIVGTALIIVFVWAFAVVKEGWDFPGDIASQAAEAQKYRLVNRSIEDYEADVAQQVRVFLKERYPPGGAVAYFKWVITSGEINPGDVAFAKRPVRWSQRRYGWVIRVVLSIVLLTLGIGSQTLLLTRAEDSKVGARAQEA